MRYKHLTRANIDISELSIGTWALSGRENFGKVDREEAKKAIRLAIEMGVNHIDTAPVYGNGYAEQLVGEVLNEGYRDKVFISTKFGLTPNVVTRMKKDLSYENVMRECQSSLMNLKTDYIDFYFIHWPSDATPISETMAALNYLKQEGKIKYIGVSNFSIDQIIEAEKYGRIDVYQPQFSMVNQKNLETMKWCHERGIDSFTYGSLGSGILSGAYRELPDFKPGDTRITFYDYFKEPKFSKIQNLLKVMDIVAQKHEKTVAQVAINWSTQNPYVQTALMGFTKEKHTIENCKAFEWTLDELDVEMLNNAIKKENLD